MRTTLIIDDEVLSQAKVRAAQNHLTLSEFTTRALRDSLQPKPTSKTDVPFRMLIFSGGSPIERSPAMLATFRDDGR